MNGEKEIGGPRQKELDKRCKELRVREQRLLLEEGFSSSISQRCRCEQQRQQQQHQTQLDDQRH